MLEDPDPFPLATRLGACLRCALDSDPIENAYEQCVFQLMNVITEYGLKAKQPTPLENDPDVKGDRRVLHALDLLRFFVLGFADTRNELYVSSQTEAKMVGPPKITDAKLSTHEDSKYFVVESHEERGRGSSLSERLPGPQLLPVAYRFSQGVVGLLLQYRGEIETLALPVMKAHPKLAQHFSTAIVAAEGQSPNPANNEQQGNEVVQIASEDHSLELLSSVTGARPVSAAALLLVMDAVNRHGAQAVHIRHKLTGLGPPPPMCSLSSAEQEGAGAASQTSFDSRRRSLSTLRGTSNVLANMLLPTHEVGVQRLLATLPNFVDAYLQLAPNK